MRLPAPDAKKLYTTAYSCHSGKERWTVPIRKAEQGILQEGFTYGRPNRS